MKTHDYTKRCTFKSKGNRFLVEQSFVDSSDEEHPYHRTENVNIWVLDEAENHWKWAMLTTENYSKIVSRLKRKGMDYFEDAPIQLV